MNNRIEIEPAPNAGEAEARRKLEETFLNNPRELGKENKLRVLKVIQILKSIVEKQLKSMKDKRMN